MSVSKKLKWRRSLSTLKFLYEELDFVKEVSKEAGPEFEKFYRKFCAEKNVNIGELDRQHKQRIDELYGANNITDKSTEEEPESESIGDTSIVVHNNKPQEKEEEDYQMSADDIAIHDAFTKLFKKIALVIHPDKIDKNLPDDEIKLRVSMFTDALESLENKKYYILLDIAERFNVTTPKNYDLQTRWMKRESDSVSANIAEVKNTYNYLFGVSETDEEKENLIRKFLQQLFRMSVQ
tara:strand:+ start:73 stop:783 length:711 start_codon:yes stop_codon:yes gene_type:complete